jgi:hypothetical protein
VQQIGWKVILQLEAVMFFGLLSNIKAAAEEAARAAMAVRAD